ncbi:MAG: hypothetical protein JO235_23505 [Chroococcidiopsidaceae cyanobacterium CP_BM_RX_35]|nr:hypothetical protein [Chroococcidiopsidaceae cyanobacterium CP_BM_RX_35]
MEYKFIGLTGERRIKTDLLTLLLNMHDYNHQNGTHRQLNEVGMDWVRRNFESFPMVVEPNLSR